MSKEEQKIHLLVIFCARITDFLGVIMKCLALATQFETDKINVHIPGNFFSTHFFIDSFRKKIEEEMSLLIAKINNDSIYFAKKGTYYLYAKRTGKNFWGLASDSELTTKELLYLDNYLFKLHIAPAEIGKDLNKYTRDLKLEAIKSDVHEIYQIMIKNIAEVLKRGERMEDLMEQAAQLQKNASIFQKSTKKINSCWSRCTIL